MTSSLFKILSVTLVLALPAQLDAFITQNTGCHHNGTWYADKSLVPAIEKCLHCQCNRKTLVCRLKVCPEMPMPPPRGCVVVQKKNTCCPYLSCARLDAFYKIPTKRRIIAYLDHYERESIDRVVNDNMLQRRSDDTEVDLFVCVKNGTVYKSGSAMSSSNLCSYCYCIGGSEKCVKPKCMLPVEGCKPIFVDSTCCPVRYDCSQKTSGKSSQEVRFRKSSNKHFLRISQRPQRNRGCTVGEQFYAEGQKMKSDHDKPCDICFCIRGARRCAPKKCSPALKNCIPVVPKGQCCPSSYDCGSQRDYRRSQNSRQFNLFSLFFGKEGQDGQNGTALAEHYPLDRHPTEPSVGNALETSSEKSIFDTLRQGLEFIDSNNNQMIADNLDLIAMQTSNAPEATTISAPTRVVVVNADEKNATGISFLDLLLGPTEQVSDDANSVEQEESTEKSTTPYKSISWVDLLLGPDDEEENTTLVEASSEPIVKQIEVTTQSAVNTNIERISDDFDDYLGSGEIAVGELPAEAQQILQTNQANNYTTNNTSLLGYTTSKLAKSTTTIPTTTEKHSKPLNTEEVTNRPTLQENLLNAFFDGISNILSASENGTNTTISTTKPDESTLSTTKTVIMPNSTQSHTQPPPPMFKPLPSHKPHSRINSKIANLIVNPPMFTTKSGQNVTFKPLPIGAIKMPIANSKIITTSTKSAKSTTTTTKEPSTIKTTTRPSTTPKITNPPKFTTTKSTTSKPTTTIPPIFITSTTTVKPLVINTNPTILDAEPLDYEATLPPSLPNLKIIPFLPTDAVNAELKAQKQQQQKQHQQFYDYYNNAQGSSAQVTSKMDYGVYDDASLYPAMTSDFGHFKETPLDKAEYKYKFKIEGPHETISELPPMPNVVPVESNAEFVKYEFGLDGTQPSKGFSPPTRTEGGFLPKESLLIGGEVLLDTTDVKNNYYVTPHIIDITTEEPSLGNMTKLIDFTTPDPFKDVIHTEPPPDLSSLINKKQIQKPSKDITLANNETVSFVPSNDHIHLPTSADVIEKMNVASRIDKAEIKQIHKLDTLLDELLAVVAKPQSTMPPFRALPTTATSIPAQPKPEIQQHKNETQNLIESHLIRSTEKPIFIALKPLRAKNITTTIQSTAASTETSLTTTTSLLSTSTTSSPLKITRKNSKTKYPQNVTATIESVPLATIIKRTSSTGTIAMGQTSKPSRTKPSHRRTTTTTTKTTPKTRITIGPKSSNTNIRVTTSSAPSQKTSTPTTTMRKTSLTSTPKISKPTFTTTLKPITNTTIYKATISSTTVHPFLMSPFDKLPFMDTSYEVKPYMMQQQKQQHPEDFNVLHYKQTMNQFEGLEPSAEVTYASTIQTSTAHSTSSSSSSSANLVDSSGMLKLAGCNIYGRMYRVDRIILELSNPCLECKCTEGGVKCGPLDC